MVLSLEIKSLLLEFICVSVITTVKIYMLLRRTSRCVCVSPQQRDILYYSIWHKWFVFLVGECCVCVCVRAPIMNIFTFGEQYAATPFFILREPPNSRAKAKIQPEPTHPHANTLYTAVDTKQTLRVVARRPLTLCVSVHITYISH